MEGRDRGRDRPDQRMTRGLGAVPRSEFQAVDQFNAGSLRPAQPKQEAGGHFAAPASESKGRTVDQRNRGTVLNTPHGVRIPAPSILAAPYGRVGMWASPEYRYSGRPRYVT
jgi:hypothetical protein